MFSPADLANGARIKSQAARATVISLLNDKSPAVRMLAVDWLMGRAEFFGVRDQKRVGQLLEMSKVDTKTLKTEFDRLVADAG